MNGVLLIYLATGISQNYFLQENAMLQNRLASNYPNPFSSFTTIYYSVKSKEQVTLKVYDMSGNEISELINSVKDEGYHSVVFYANSDLGSGVYIYTLRVGDFIESKTMVFNKLRTMEAAERVTST